MSRLTQAGLTLLAISGVGSAYQYFVRGYSPAGWVVWYCVGAVCVFYLGSRGHGKLSLAVALSATVPPIVWALNR